MTCSEFIKCLDLYVDGEFTDEDRIVLAAHLYGCEPCRNQVEAERGFRQRLRTLGQETKAPESLRARLCTMIRSEIEERTREEYAAVSGIGTADHVGGIRAEHARRSEKKTNWSQRWLWRILPAAAAIVLIVGAFFSERRDLDTVAEQSVVWHRARVPMDVAGAKLEDIKRFFAEKVPFAMRLPRFAQKNIELEGARLSSLAGHRAAHLRYRLNGESISVLVMDARALPEIRIHRSGSNRIHWRDFGGYHVGFYESNGIGYAITSSVTRPRLVQLLRP